MTEVDWSALTHAYGSATDVPGILAAMRSPDVVERGGAFRDYYSKVLHQGSVYSSTTASLPLLFALAVDVAVPGRVDVVELLVRVADAVFSGSLRHAEAALVLRSRAETFAALAADPDSRIRAAAVPALPLVIDDARRALQLLRDRLPGAHGIGERLALVAAIGTVASRHSDYEPDAVALLATIDGDPVTRLACFVHQACFPSNGVRDNLASAAIELLRLIAQAPSADLSWTTTPYGEAVSARPGLPAAFKDLRQAAIVHAPTTEVLLILHDLLGDRVMDRTAVLLEQLRSPDPGTRHDAVWMARSFVSSWRGDHTALIVRIGELLVTDRHEVAAEAADALARIPNSELAREALAAYVVARPPETWAEDRHGYQNAVVALAELGDARALPALLFALDGGVGNWSATRAIGYLPMAAADLIPRLTGMLAELEDELQAGAISGINTQIQFDSWADRILEALARLQAPSTLPTITGFLATVIRHRQWKAAGSALKALTVFGPEAQSLELIRTLGPVQELRTAVVAALAVIGADPQELIPAALRLIADGTAYDIIKAVDALGHAGPRAAGRGGAAPATRVAVKRPGSGSCTCGNCDRGHRRRRRGEPSPPGATGGLEERRLRRPGRH